MRFVDTHAHLFFKEYEADLDLVLMRAVDAGVAQVVVPGTDLATSREAIALAERHPMLFAAVGIHPHEASTADAAALAEIERMSVHPRVVAIGEIGLDYHYDFSPRDTQRSVFAEQIGIAIRRNLPVIIHSREAESDTLDIVRRLSNSAPEWCRPGPRGRRGVFHCFPGDTRMAEEVIALGFFLSFPGPVTFPARPNKPNAMAEVASAVGLEHVLLETDSPYLTPVPNRGKRNEPSMIPEIARKVAELSGRAIEDVAQTTTRNAEWLFSLPGGIHET